VDGPVQFSDAVDISREFQVFKVDHVFGYSFATASA